MLSPSTLQIDNANVVSLETDHNVALDIGLTWTHADGIV